jgi:hypothetical protein
MKLRGSWMQWLLAACAIPNTQISQGVSQPGDLAWKDYFVGDQEYPGCVWISAGDVEHADSLPSICDFLLESRGTKLVHGCPLYAQHIYMPPWHV